jgi:hypothetical protein
MIPADAPPSFDAHREGTFATVHSAAPFYSVLIRVDSTLEPAHQRVTKTLGGGGANVACPSQLSQTPRDHRSELQHPAPDGFVGDVEPALGEEILYISLAQREAQ